MSEEKQSSSKPGFFSNVVSEFKKCTWPKPQDLAKQSTLVIVVSLVLGVLIAGVDWLIRTGLAQLNIG